MRTIWKGRLQFGMVTIAVRIFNASSPETDIKFAQLHKQCNGAIGVKRYCKKCQMEVDSESIVLGFEYSPSLYVVMEDNDLASVKLSSTKLIEVQGFVRATDIPASLYEAPYFLGPDGDKAAGDYGVLREAMRETGKVAIGKVVMGNREIVVAISPEESGILLHKLRSPSTLKPVLKIPGLEQSTHIDDNQVLLTRVVIDYMTKPLAAIDLTDRYRESVLDVIAKKVAGEKLVAVPDADYPEVDMEAALTLSIEHLKHQLEEPKVSKAKSAAILMTAKKTRRSRKIQTVSDTRTPIAKTVHEEKKKI